MTLGQTEIGELVRLALDADAVSGYHHANHVARHNGRKVVVRVPRSHRDRYDVDMRIWPEWEILEVARRHGVPCPRVHGVDPATGAQVHEHIDGVAVESGWPRGGPAPAAFIDGAAAALRALRAIGRDALPPLPAGWPDSGDAPGLLRTLAAVTRTVFDAERDRLAWAFSALGLPPDPLAPLEPLPDRLRGRPFTLCHADIHRGNWLLSPDGGGTLVDWELAIYGDPAFDLAVHLHKTGYAPADEARLIERVTDGMAPRDAAALLADARVYRLHEQVKSAIVDVVRYRARVAVNAPPTAGWASCQASHSAGSGSGTSRSRGGSPAGR
jgi:aminoglycoside phosphotransferase (APT) family kinase protein